MKFLKAKSTMVFQRRFCRSKNEVSSPHCDEEGVPRPRPRVRFGRLEIYVFASVLGDNPCAEGAPLALNSHPDYMMIFYVDDYERCRSPRRKGWELHLSSIERENYLLSSGYRYDDVVEASKRNAHTQHEREQSYKAANWERLLVCWEFLYHDVVLNIRYYDLAPRQILRYLCVMFLAFFLAR